VLHLVIGTMERREGEGMTKRKNLLSCDNSMLVKKGFGGDKWL